MAVYVAGIHHLVVGGQFVGTFHERGDDGMLVQFVGIRMDIVPHDKLTEREETQQRLLDDGPCRLLCHSLAHGVEHLFHVYTAVIPGQGLQLVEVEAEVLLQQLYQRDVEHDVLVALANDILAGTFAHNVDRQ